MVTKFYQTRESVYDAVPWKDSSKWKKGCWYPMAVGSMWCDKVTVMEGYDIFTQDPEMPDDIIPAGEHRTLTFREAIKICEDHNKWSFNL